MSELGLLELVKLFFLVIGSIGFNMILNFEFDAKVFENQSYKP